MNYHNKTCYDTRNNTYSSITVNTFIKEQPDSRKMNFSTETLSEKFESEVKQCIELVFFLPCTGNDPNNVSIHLIQTNTQTSTVSFSDLIQLTNGIFVQTQNMFFASGQENIYVAIIDRKSFLRKRRMTHTVEISKNNTNRDKSFHFISL